MRKLIIFFILMLNMSLLHGNIFKNIDSLYRYVITSIDSNCINENYDDSTITNVRSLQEFNFTLDNKNEKLILFTKNRIVKKIRIKNANKESLDLYLFYRDNFLFILMKDNARNVFSNGIFLYDKSENIWLFLALKESPINRYFSNHSISNSENIVSIFLANSHLVPMNRINFINKTFATYSYFIFKKNKEYFELMYISKLDINTNEFLYKDVLLMLKYGYTDPNILTVQSRIYKYNDLSYWLNQNWDFYQ